MAVSKKTRSKPDWPSANQRHLMSAVGQVRARLDSHFKENSEAVKEADLRMAEAVTALPSPAALDSVVTLFGLSPFERDLLVLCAGVELDGEFAAFVAQLPAATPVRISYSLALAALPNPHWSVLNPHSPLQYWQLVIPGAGDSITRAPLRIDERVLLHLTGLRAIDRRLADNVELVPKPNSLPDSHRQIAQELAETWRASGSDWPLLQLCGGDAPGHRALAALAAHELSLRLHSVDARDIPTAPGDRLQWMRLWERESILDDSALFVDCSDGVNAEVIRTLQRLPGAVFVSAREALPLSPRTTLRREIPRPTAQEQRALWTEALGENSVFKTAEIDAVVAQFDLPAAAITLTASLATSPAGSSIYRGTTKEKSGEESVLWRLCRAQMASRLGELAQQIEPRGQWENLVLPAPQMAILTTIVAQIRQRSRVFSEWGFDSPSARGLGSSVLFAGPSGTGKTMAAEVLAGLLELDLYRIDLSAVVSKYIGETEKNLRRVFDAAEAGGAVLLFDEADALFGRRSEVKDSHDRYANIEVSYLLQRMEAYRGLAILTTNLKQSLDSAFIRRLRFIVQFPYPETADRAKIWEGIFPKDTPKENLDFQKLAQLNMAGGNIRAIAVNAAFLAAEQSGPVRMGHLLTAAQAEAAKLERPLLDKEVAGWT